MNVHGVASPTDPHWVYRFFGENDAPLYVGCTSNLAQRLGDHRRYRDWYSQVERLEVTKHEGYAEAMAAEAAEIKRLNPAHNTVYTTTSREPDQPCRKCRRSRHGECVGVNRRGEPCPCSICEAQRKRTAA